MKKISPRIFKKIEIFEEISTYVISMKQEWLWLNYRSRQSYKLILKNFKCNKSQGERQKQRIDDR
jgi:hypothetical protein